MLVVDDEPTIGEIMAAICSGQASRRCRLDGPAGGRDEHATHTPDLVILDIMLPGFDGLEVMRRLHESETRPTPSPR